MNENSTNTNLNSEDGQKAAYSSSYHMNKELFYDFSSVNYNRMKKVFLFLFFFLAFEIVANILVENYDIVPIALYISFLFCILYFMMKNAVKVNYERNMISLGNETVFKEELWEDKIVSSVDELKREYFYHQITGFLKRSIFFCFI